MEDHSEQPAKPADTPLSASPSSEPNFEPPVQVSSGDESRSAGDKLVEQVEMEHSEKEAGKVVSKGSGTPSRGGTKSSGQRRQRTMLVRYGKMGFVGIFRHSERDIPTGSAYVVVKTERGMEIGQIISPFCHHRGQCSIPSEKINRYYEMNGPNYPVSRHGTVVRFASEMDLRDQKHLNGSVRDKMRFCQQLIEKLNLPMKLIDAEHLFGGERMIFYFMADGRVDFRELVKQLAHQYQTRIEMRQVGARDEARLIADYETCGRECCCKSFLKVLQPINMRMAKLQKATLDPSKISGRCGRLKCCLRYEDEVYTELHRRLPRRNMRVLTEYGAGTVIETQVLTQLVKVRMELTERVVAVPEDELVERDYKGPAKVVKEKPATPPRSEAGPEPPADTSETKAPPAPPKPSEEDKSEQPQATSSEEKGKKHARRGRRRRRRKKK